MIFFGNFTTLTVTYRVFFENHEEYLTYMSYNLSPISAMTVKNETKYLGVVIDKRLTCGPHLKERRKSANQRLHLLRPFLKFNLLLKTKLLIFKAIIRTIWSYGFKFGVRQNHLTLYQYKYSKIFYSGLSQNPFGKLPLKFHIIIDFTSI